MRWNVDGKRTIVSKLQMQRREPNNPLRLHREQTKCTAEHGTSRNPAYAHSKPRKGLSSILTFFMDMARLDAVRI